MLRRMRSRYNSRCSLCHAPIAVGDQIYWSRATKALCLNCGGGNTSESKPQPKETPAVPDADYKVIEWADLREYCRNAVLKGDYGKLRKANVIQNRDYLEQPTTHFEGYERDTLKRWIVEGYETETIKGLGEFTPPIREKRRLQFMEEGEELHLDIAWSGGDNFMSEWTKREVIPGAAIEANIGVQAGTKSEVLNAFNRWLCRAIFSLESAGIDCEVTLKYRASHLFNSDSYGKWRETIIRVKKENEATDFGSFSSMIGPAQFRTFFFVANTLHADSLGKDVSSGQGNGDYPGRTWGVSYDPETRKIKVETPWHPHDFPEQEMTESLVKVLKEMKG